MRLLADLLMGSEKLILNLDGLRFQDKCHFFLAKINKGLSSSATFPQGQDSAA